MARATTGPLTGIVRGAVGDIEFRWTRHGQVVQGKGVPPTHTTAPAVRAKRRVAALGMLWSNPHEGWRPALRQLMANAPPPVMARWSAPYLRWLAGGDWRWPDRLPREDLTVTMTALDLLNRTRFLVQVDDPTGVSLYVGWAGLNSSQTLVASWTPLEASNASLEVPVAPAWAVAWPYFTPPAGQPIYPRLGVPAVARNGSV